MLLSLFAEDHVLYENSSIDKTVFCIRMMTVDDEYYVIVLKFINSANNVFERIGFALWGSRENISQDGVWYSEGKEEVINLV